MAGSATSRSLEVTVRVTDMDVFKRLLDFLHEYADHTRDCAAYDVDGEWMRRPCTCGFDDAIAAIRGEGIDA
jgi:hypothetical protein